MKLKSLKSYDSSIVLIKGNDEISIVGLTDMSNLKSNHIVFIKNKNYLNELLEKVSEGIEIGVIVEAKYYQSMDENIKQQLDEKSKFVLTTSDVNISMSLLSKPFFDEKYQDVNDVIDGRQMGSADISPEALIAQGVFIGEKVIIRKNVKIHPGVTVMSGVVIDEGAEIFPHVVIYRDVKIGKNVRIHSNTTIGADGFGYNFKDGIHHKVWHMGSVVIGNNVEIGSNTSIDSGTFSPTIIGDGSKIDNLVQVGHNCKLGRGVILCGQVALGGSTTIGDYTVFGGKSGASNGVVIGNQVQVAGMAGVTNNVNDKEVVAGFPARDIKEWMKGIAFVRKLSIGDKK